MTVKLFDLLTVSCAVFAQEMTGSISGVASVSSLVAVIPGATVTVTNIGTNTGKVVVTGQSGAYRVPFLFGTEE